MSEREELVKRLKDIIEDLDTNRHMWADDHTAYKVADALRIILQLLGEEVAEDE